MEASAPRPPSLQTFSLEDLAPYTREGSFDPRDSPDYRTLYVGRDDVHGALMHLFGRVAVSVKFSMFGYDDDELDALIVALIGSEHCYFQGTLDKSQSGGVHEQKILAAWSDAVRASFAIGTSATGQIEHTKGGVLDGVVMFEGSTNWSSSGEGTGIGLHGQENAAGYKAQANTLSISTNPVEVHRFQTRLDEEHASIVQRQLAKASAQVQAAAIEQAAAADVPAPVDEQPAAQVEAPAGPEQADNPPSPDQLPPDPGAPA